MEVKPESPESGRGGGEGGAVRGDFRKALWRKEEFGELEESFAAGSVARDIKFDSQSLSIILQSTIITSLWTILFSFPPEADRLN